jgi:hypothetical protein
MAAVAFAGSLAILFVLIFEADKLVRLGLQHNVYYVLLVPLGLCVAAALFGVMDSYAVYRGKALHGTLRLGGPIVGFLLVVILGFLLVPDRRPFPLTVYVQDGSQPVRGGGSVFIDFGGNRRDALIDQQGQARFLGIPPSFMGQPVRVGVDIPGYEVVKPDFSPKLDGESVYVSVRPKAVRIFGHVKDPGGSGIQGAQVRVGRHGAKTDRYGYYELTIPGASLEEAKSIHVNAPGYAPSYVAFAPGENSIQLQPR